MKETPLIFCTAMVQAYRAGLKSMTRRVVKLAPELKRMGGDLDKAWVDGKGSNDEYLHIPCVNDSAGEPWDETIRDSFLDHRKRLYYPYGEPGTQFWIREAWYDYGSRNSRWHGLKGNRSDGILGPLYVADNPQIFHDSLGNDWNAAENGQRKERGAPYWRKKPSIFLPRWACRMTMPLTRVRVERLQDISTEDIKAEGFCLPPDELFPRTNTEYKLREVLKRGWDKINGKRAGCKWADNPWIWVLEFPRYNGDR